MNYPNIKCLIRVSKKLEGEGRVPSLVSKELMEVKEEDVKSE